MPRRELELLAPARDAAIERWLIEEVVPTIEALDAGRSRTMSLEEARDRLHARIDALVRQHPRE